MSALGETFTFDLEALMLDTDKTRAAFTAAEPFPHAVIDGFLTPAALAAAVEAFPPADARRWNLQDWTSAGSLHVESLPHRLSLRGAQRRSNPESRLATLDCFATLAMTAVIAST
jgi:hypothetical protein